MQSISTKSKGESIKADSIGPPRGRLSAWPSGRGVTSSKSNDKRRSVRVKHLAVPCGRFPARRPWPARPTQWRAGVPSAIGLLSHPLPSSRFRIRGMRWPAISYAAMGLSYIPLSQHYTRQQTTTNDCSRLQTFNQRLNLDKVCIFAAINILNLQSWKHLNTLKASRRERKE